jgi:hypothetical protein
MTVNRRKFCRISGWRRGQSLVTDELAGNHREDAEAQRSAKELNAKWKIVNVECKSYNTQ